MASILLIEDDDEFRVTVQTMLESASHGVTMASDGREGLDLIASRKFDLVVTDILMPEKEGIEIIIALRESHPTLPIIAISGGGRIKMGSDLLTMARRFGAMRTLQKPFTLKQLTEAVDACLAPGATPPTAG